MGLDPIAEVSPIERFMELAQVYQESAEGTSVFRDLPHDQLVEGLNDFVFHHGPAMGVSGWGDNIQSLRDSGVDAVWQCLWKESSIRIGFQVKSHSDFTASGSDSFRRGVLAQITESRQLGLENLLVVLGADLTNNSISQKARGLLADFGKMPDGYVVGVSPEKLAGIWTWWIGLKAEPLEQICQGGYAWLTIVFDDLGNRNTNSWGKGQGGNWSGPKTTILTEGQIVHITAIGISPEPDNMQFYFAIQRSGRSFETRQDWSDKNSWEWTVTRDDIGRNVCVKVAIRRQKDYYQFEGADDYTYATYDVLPATG